MLCVVMVIHVEYSSIQTNKCRLVFFCLFFWLRDLLTDRVLKPVPSSVPKPPNTPVQPPALVNVPTHPYDRQYYPQAHRG